MLDRCLFAARGPAVESELMAARAARLRRYFAPLGPATLSLETLAGGAVTVGAIGFGAGPVEAGAPQAFGAQLPAALAGADPARLADAQLRELGAASAVIAPSGESAIAVSSARAPTALFRAASGGREAVSTHAVAAAFLASGSVRLDPSALVELIAFEFTGGRASLVAGVEALPAATRIELRADRAEARCFWPARERWAPVAEDGAFERAAEALFASLGRDLAGLRAPTVGLTAGLDSQVVAAALRELGIGFEAFTWGDAGAPDVTGAARAAAELGVPHSSLEPGWLGDVEALTRARADARWTEAGLYAGFGELRYPEGMSALVTGSGGETGRSYYYRRAALARGGEPTVDELVAAPLAELSHKLTGASPAARRRLRHAVRDWVAEAQDAGAAGWRALDIVYADQRMRRWGRGMLRRGGEPMIFGLADPELQRALASQPLSSRLADGFHREFLARHAPDLVPESAPPAPARRRAPAAVRRAGARVRAAFRRPLPAALPGSAWDERPAFAEWIEDAVLASPLIAEGLGERWAARTRRRYREDGIAESGALWAAAAVALDEAFADLG